MTTPAKAASQTQESEFAKAVNTAVAAMTQDAKGNMVLPEGLSEEVAYAATLEKRRRDTQSAYTKERQTKKALEDEKALLLSKVSGTVKLELTAAQTEELEELKFSDPEDWRKKMNSYETEARTKQLKTINEELKQVSSSSQDTEELTRREQVLADFNQAHPDLEITQELIDSEIPPRITKQLANGTIEFDEFLEAVYKYATTGKTVKQEKTGKGPNMSKVAGSSSPDENAVKQDSKTSYTKEVY